MERKKRSLLAGGIALALLLPAWWFLAPPALGGRVSYVVVARGASMEPNLHPGDLVLTRRAQTYRVGDAIAYKSRDIGRVVLHRIIAVEGGRYVLRGDSNDFVDPFKPSHQDVIGKRWIDVPVVGSAFNWLGVPSHAAVVAGLLAFLAIGGSVGARARRRRSSVVRPIVSAAGSEPGSRLVVLTGTAAVATLLFIALGLFAFTRPLMEQARSSVPYSHIGRFSYSAAVPPGATYARSSVRSGDPVYLRLADRLDVRFAYRVEAEGPVSTRGSMRLLVDIRADDGWSRRLATGPESIIGEAGPVARAVVDLDRVSSLIEAVERATQISRVAYSLVVTADVRATGVVGDIGFSDRFSPATTLQWTPLQIGVPTATEGTDPFVTTEQRSATRVASVRGSLPYPGGRVDVASVRRTSAIGGIIALMLALFSGARALRLLRGDEPALIALRYRTWLISVRPGTSVGGPIVDVISIGDLVRLAESAEELILHEEQGRLHSYFLEHGGAVYRYRAAGPGSEPLVEEEATEPQSSLPQSLASRVISPRTQ